MNGVIHFKNMIMKAADNRHRYFWIGAKSTGKQPFKWTLDASLVDETLFPRQSLPDKVNECPSEGDCCLTINGDGFLKSVSCQMKDCGIVCQIAQDNINNAVWDEVSNDQLKFLEKVTKKQNQTVEIMDKFADHVSKLKCILEEDRSKRQSIFVPVLIGLAFGWLGCITLYLARGCARRRNRRGTLDLSNQTTPKTSNGSVNRSYSREEETERKVPLVIA